MQKLIMWLFSILLFFVPIVLWPYTSEVFEFNKIVLVYVLTVLIFTAWVSRCLVEKRIIFRRTLLDIPLLIFLGSQITSTLLSIDTYTSIFGYYSRFNGGLLSTICYSLLYWAYVSNIDRKQTLFIIRTSLFSAALVAIYGVLEHFGIDKDLWVQDVQSRVFSTLGQPNWLAAWVTALIPILLALMINAKKLNAKFLYLSLSVLFFITLLFTKSRSGLVGFLVADVVFWILYFINSFRTELKKFLISFVICNLSFVIMALIIGTQFTPSIRQILQIPVKNPVPMAQGTVLENGGTESGTIRKFVWQGALQIWKNYPIFGTGLETFAYSYYSHRPIEHNVTSEWDFIYNKAHNEFLNTAANSGSIGLISYLVLIGFIIFIFIQKLIKFEKSLETGNWQLEIALLAGFISLSISNFFGFSVVPTQLLFFLFPAFAITLAVPSTEYLVRSKKTENYQKILIAFVLCTMVYVLVSIGKYWYADVLYSKAKAQNSVNRPDLAFPILDNAIKLAPKQAIYYGEQAISYSTIAMAYNQAQEATAASEFSNLAVMQIQKALTIAPANINLSRQMFGIYVRLSTIDEKYLSVARDVLIHTLKMAPTDPKLYFNLGVAHANLGETAKALTDFERAIELKPNYGDARVQYAALLLHLDRVADAKEQLNYVLTKIDPGNETARRALDNIK